MSDREQLQAIVIATTVFVLVFCVWGMVLIGWSMKRRSHREHVERRLGLAAGQDADGPESQRVLRLWRDGEELTTEVATDRVQRSSLLLKLERLPERFGLDVPVQSLLLGIGGVLLLAGVIGYVLTSSIVATLSIVGVTAATFWIVGQQRRAAQARTFENQFIDALRLVARSLRAGHPLQGAFQLVASEMGRPISTIFADIVQQQSLGLSMEDALERTAAGHWSEDLKLFATSVSIQLRSGGNLADMMERLAAVITERLRLARRIKVLTSQSQMSKRVLLVMPVGMFAVLSLIQPDYIDPMLSTQVGQYMLAFAIVSLGIGSWFMNRLSELRY